jgi:hypothetical protein
VPKKITLVSLVLFISMMFVSCSAIGGFFASVFSVFWWVVLGVCVIVYIFAVKHTVESPDAKTDVDVYFIMALFSAPVIACAILGGKLIGGVISVLVGGLVVGSVIGGIPYSIISGRAARKKEAKKAAREEAKAEREREEERLAKIERNRPFEERLATIENDAKTKLEKNSQKLEEANRDYSKIRSNNNNVKPENRLKRYKQDEAADDVFNSKIWDAFSDSGVAAAQERVENLQNIGEYFAASCNLAQCKARFENDIYTANRKKAVLFVEQLKEIYSKLTAKQKERQINDAAKQLHIGKINISIPNSVGDVKDLAIQYSDGRKEAIGEALTAYSKEYRRNKRIDSESAGRDALLNFTALAVGNLVSKHEDNKKLKEQLERAQGKLYKKIANIADAEVNATAFADRAHTINISIEKAMEAYTKMFEDVYKALYPADDDTKSKAQRQARKKTGGTYFTDEESEAIIQLGTTGKFLLQIVDTKFEGDDDGE